jgi:putative CocE/NonD family hydrolase
VPASQALKIETNVAVPMRDGTRLYADIYRPEGPGPCPVLLQRTPYDKSMPLSRNMLDPLKAARHGYVVVIQDTRGRYTSEGEFYAFRDDSHDGYDTVEWAASQPWCSGKVGMYGNSYVGATQWQAAKSCPPHLAAIAPRVTASNYHEGWTYQGGAFELGFNVSWTLGNLTLANFLSIAARKPIPQDRRVKLAQAVDALEAAFRFLPLQELPHLQDGLADYFYDWLAHPDYDDYWKHLSIEESHSRITVPALNIGGWYDIFLGGTIRNYLGMREKGATQEARRGQKLLIGPWQHGSSRGPGIAGDHYFGLGSDPLAIDLEGVLLRWFDCWLKGAHNGIMDEPPVRLFVMGDNVWRVEQEWPLARAQSINYYLHSQGKANSINGDGALSPQPPGDEPPDVFLYNPADPVPTRGGPLCCHAYFLAGGAYDQQEIERRQDVLVYSTPPLERDVEVTGPITVTLWAATSAPDTDFTAKLVDVCEHGCARNLTDGIIRARYRESKSTPSLVEPGRAYGYTIDLWATSNVFKAGHRIRVEVSSSNFPRFDRNTNTGKRIAEHAELKPALQTILHSAPYPSHIALPIVPR